MGLGQGGDDVEVERLAVGAGLLGAVEHGHLAHARGQRREQRVGRERPVEAQLEHADPLAPTDEVGHGLAHRLSARAHDHDDPVGLGVPGVLGDAVLPAGVRGDLVHDLLHHGGHAA